jgi:hypothetical protein
MPPLFKISEIKGKFTLSLRQACMRSLSYIMLEFIS